MIQDTNNPAANFFADAEVISRYTRAQALADGVLKDAGATAREAGIKFPVALTQAAWDSYVTVPEGLGCQDEDGRLWDIVYMFAQAAKRSRGGSRITFELFVRNSKRQRLDRRDMVTLEANIGPGDTAAPVITIGLIGED
jgi:hypothetical protein